jgi:hypothetical protein
LFGKKPITAGICACPTRICKILSWWTAGLLWEGFDERDINDIDSTLVAVISQVLVAAY